MPETLVSRITSGQHLGGVALGALATIVVGAGAYGFSFGIWRAPEQALYSALKLPALLLALVLVTTFLNAMLAQLLRAPLGLRQSAVCILVGLATTAAILGALSPVSAYMALSVPPPDPTVFGLALQHPRAAAANRAAQSLLLYHVAVIAIAGVLGNLRLYSLLRRIGGRRDIALRVLVAWLAVELLAGSELSWIFRPFLGRPHRAPELVSSEMFEGSFFEEVGEALLNAVGVEGLISVGVIAAVIALSLWRFVRSDGLRVDVEADARGIDVRADEARFFVPWHDVVDVRPRHSTVLLEPTHELVIDVVGAPAARLLVRFETAEPRDELALRVHRLRRRLVGPGPFRQPGRAPDQETAASPGANPINFSRASPGS